MPSPQMIMRRGRDLRPDMVWEPRGRDFRGPPNKWGEYRGEPDTESENSEPDTCGASPRRSQSRSRSSDRQRRRRRHSSSPERGRRHHHRKSRRSKSPARRSRSPRRTSISPRRESVSPRRHHHRHKHHHRDENRTSRRRHRDDSPDPKPPHQKRSPIRSSKALVSQQSAFQTESDPTTSITPAIEKQVPNFRPTGRLAAESNTIKSSTTSSRSALGPGGAKPIVLKYHEPPEARKPPPAHAWRMYVFAGKEIVETIPLWERSCWLLGAEGRVVDVLLEGGKGVVGQHAVIQFRYNEKRGEFGERTGRVKPYVLDLESRKDSGGEGKTGERDKGKGGVIGGTWLNGTELEAGRYVEVRDGDELKFGEGGKGEREYVLQLPPV